MEEQSEVQQLRENLVSESHFKRTPGNLSCACSKLPGNWKGIQIDKNKNWFLRAPVNYIRRHSNFFSTWTTHHPTQPICRTFVTPGFVEKDFDPPLFVTVCHSFFSSPGDLFY
jgi:hypothetical protein